MTTSIMIGVNGVDYEVDGSRLLTEAEFNCLKNYVKQYNDEIAKLDVERQRYLELEEKFLNLTPTAELTETNLDDAAELAEIEAARCSEKITQWINRIDEIWSIAPETVTGGGYGLHTARWGNDV